MLDGYIEKVATQGKTELEQISMMQFFRYTYW